MEISTFKDEEFQRHTGIKRKIYDKMLELVTEAYRIAKTKGRAKSKFRFIDL